MKAKMNKKIPSKVFLLFLAFLMGLPIVAFGQESVLQGTWFEGDLLFWITFDNGSYQTMGRGGEPNDKGEYIISGNTITRTRTHTHSSSIEGGTRYGWYSMEEAVVEFGSWIAGWFEPRTQTFSISGDILTIIFPSGVKQQFTRER